MRDGIQHSRCGKIGKPAGFQNKNIKIAKIPLKECARIFILKRSTNLKGVVINTYICYTY